MGDPAEDLRPRLLLGVDTGGTYTDAVILDSMTGEVLAKAKALTTHHDLSAGIEAAILRVLHSSSTAGAEIDLVSLSTTLATNALVEGARRPAGLVAVGFSTDDLRRAGVPDAVADDRIVLVTGGHDSHGLERQPLDLDAVLAAAPDLAKRVDAFAVTAQFAVRNPAHELAVRDALIGLTGQPVTCSHELSAQLNGPKRAVTALLNAQLVSVTAELLDTFCKVTDEAEINAPLMIVRGDGSLVSADFVRRRPVETILSGPAASVVGASALSDQQNALVIDMGGTTTDSAILLEGKPLHGGHGAVVGGHHTMIDALDMHTTGLGGDSEVALAGSSADPITIGPRRVVPLARLLSELEAGPAASVVETMRSQLRRDVARDTDGSFAWADLQLAPPTGLSDLDRSVLAHIRDLREPLPLDELDQSGRTRNALLRLVRRGAVRLVGFTPTDAAVVLGLHREFRPAASEASHLGAGLLARGPDRFGNPISASPADAAQLVIDLLVRRSAEAALSVMLDHDALPSSEATGPLVSAVLDARARDSTCPDELVRIDVGSRIPVVAVGAAATTYYPAVGALLDCEVEIPLHADVANAVGAAVGRVRVEQRINISAPRRGLYRVHGDGEPTTLYALDEARRFAEARLRSSVAVELDAAGATEYEIGVEWTDRQVEVDGRPLFVEGVMVAVGTGRPRLR